MKIILYGFFSISIVSCNMKQKRINKVKQIYSIHNQIMDSTVNLLNKIINENKADLNGENIFFVISNNNISKKNIIQSSKISKILKTLNFSSIHIYNKVACDKGNVEYQTYSFEYNSSNVLLEYYKCLYLQPQMSGNYLKNTRVTIEKMNTNWFVISENF